MRFKTAISKGRLVLPLIFACLFFTQIVHSTTVQNCDAMIRSGIEAMNRSEHVKSLEQLTQAREWAIKNNWYVQQFLAINNIGANYYMLLEYGEALNYYLEAYTIALKQLDPKYEMIVLNNIAILYSKEKKYDKANEYFHKAYDIALLNKDSLKVGLYSMNMGNVANEKNDTKTGRNYFSRALPLLKSQPEFHALARIGLADCDYADGNIARARSSALEMLATVKDLDFNDIGISLLTIVAKCYLKEGNPQNALVYAKKIFERNPNLETRIGIFQLLSEISFKQKDFQQAISYKDSILHTTEKFNALKNSKLFENSKVKFEIQNYQNEIALKESKLESERKIFYWVLFVICFLVIGVVWALRNRSIKHKQKKLIAERNEQILSLELQKEKSELLLLEKQLDEAKAMALLEQEQYKNEVESKNRKLSAKALYLSGRNQMIEDVLSELSQLPQVAKDISVVNHIEVLKNHLKTDKEWDNFITHFEEVNQTFLNNLKSKHPNLTANDIRFISYIYMNLSTKEIAAMLNIAPESCRKRKERISAKMELPEDLNLYNYLASL